MLKALLTIIRWPNLLIVGGIQAIVFYTLTAYDQSRMIMPEVLLLIFVTLCITAGGNVINDYYDSDIDQVNRPRSWVVGNTLSKPVVLNIYKAIILIGALGAFLFAFRLHLLLYFPIYLLAVVGLQIYSTHLKCKPVVGNLLVATYCGAVVLIMVVPDILLHNQQIVHPQFWYYIFFAFLITFFREIIKDIEDHTGDQQFKCQTFAVRYGLKNGKILASIAGCIALASLMFWENSQANRWVSLGLVVLQGSVVGALALLWYGKDANYYHKASTLIKLVMVAGTLLLFVQY